MFAHRLKLLRTERHLTQADMAKAFLITTRSYQYYEAGKREPTIDMLCKFADFFGVSLDYLCGRCENRRFLGAVRPEGYELDIQPLFNKLSKVEKKAVMTLIARALDTTVEELYPIEDEK